jgi:hypothetical protein
VGRTSQHVAHGLWMFAFDIYVRGAGSFITDAIGQGPELQLDVAALIEGFTDAAEGDSGCDVQEFLKAVAGLAQIACEGTEQLQF